MNYEGLILFGQNLDIAGRGIAGPRLRTAASKAGFNVFVTDITSHLTEEQIFEIIDIFVNKGIKFIGFSVAWIGTNAYKILQDQPCDVWFCDEFFQKLTAKYPNLLIITGGHRMPENGKKPMLFSYTDYHFNGFSDVSFVEFLKYINKQPHNLIFEKNEKLKGYLIDSDKNFPVLDPNTIETVFVEEDRFEPYQPLPIELSRGCIFRCAFCNHPFQGKKTYDSYQRTPENIALELKRNYDLFGTTRYTLMDDTFNDSLEKIDRLSKAIDLAKLPKFEFVAYIKPELLVTKPETIKLMADIGLRGAFLGLESFNNKTRKVIGRGVSIERINESVFKLSEINNSQVLVHGGFIVGLPHETPDEVYKTWEFLQKNARTYCRSWLFKDLIMWDRKDQVGGLSLFESKPELYGYKLLGGSNWENEFFTKKSAKKLADHLNATSRNYCGGWKVAGAWHMDMPTKVMENDIWSGQSALMTLFQACQDRSQVEFKKLVEKYK
jgi:hypothetical protein